MFRTCLSILLTTLLLTGTAGADDYPRAYDADIYDDDYPGDRKIFDIRDGVNIAGRDIPGTDVRGISMRECIRHCRAIPDCLSFTYRHDKRWCFPKTGVGRLERYSYVSSGAVRELSDRLFARSRRHDGDGVEYGIDFPGGDLYRDGIRDVSRRDCRRICLDDDRCAAYTYVPDTQWCWPKSYVSRRRPERRAVSEQIR